MKSGGLTWTQSQRESPNKPGLTMQCPLCDADVKVGTGGLGNLVAHQAGRKCREKQKKRSVKVRSNLETLNHADNPPPSPANGPNPLLSPNSSCLNPLLTLGDHSQADSGIESSRVDSLVVSSGWDIACPHALRLLQQLRYATSRLPESVPFGSDTGALARLSAHLDENSAMRTCSNDEAWELLDRQWNNTLGWATSPTELLPAICRGMWGMDGLCTYLEWAIHHKGIQGALIEGKLTQLIQAMALLCGETSTSSQASAIIVDVIPTPTSMCSVEINQIPLAEERYDLDKVELGARVLSSSTSERLTYHPGCQGVPLPLPAGSSPYTSYPFQLHDRPNMTLPWEPAIIRNRFYVRSTQCSGRTVGTQDSCDACLGLLNHPVLDGIIRRIRLGSHEKMPRDFQSTACLLQLLEQKTQENDKMRLTCLNNTKRILTLTTALGNHKKFLMAIGSGRVDRCHALVSVALRNGSGIRHLIDTYERAASRVYKPKGYTEQEQLRALAFLTLGGARLATLAQHSMGSPCVTTLRAHSPVKSLRGSPGAPTLDEAMYNIRVSLGVNFNSQPTGQSQGLPSSGGWYILMWDELKVQERLRWMPEFNVILGVCREHSQDLTFKFSSMDEATLIFDRIANQTTHLGTEATVASIGRMSSNPALYSARPVLISGTCKREKAPEHANLLSTVISACRQMETPANLGRLYCLASDGDATQGAAFVQLTMKHRLSESSRIYPLLSPLLFMNLLVGDDDLTGDKDYKHVLKRLRNVLLRASGIIVLGTLITPALLRLHLIDNGMSLTRVNHLLNPNDKQDVPLALSLLREIWLLPGPNANAVPAYACVRSALNTLGYLFYLLVTPYTDIKLSLNDQIKRLAAAAHLTLLLFVDRGTSTRFLPHQLYSDIMTMVKNVYFCLAKTKADDPSGSFWLILLGTDRLETSFGLLRTMIGNDTNADVLQLCNRLSSVALVSNILAEHPEWGGVARRLKLPSIDANGDVSSSLDHISPSMWQGNIRVDSVVLHSCWKLGRQIVTQHLRHYAAENLFLMLESNPAVDIFSPFGRPLFNMPSDNLEEFEDPQAAAIVRNNSVPLDDSSLDIEDEAHLLDETSHTRPAGDPLACPSPPYIEHQGSKLHKARILRNQALYSASLNSTDRLAWVAGRSRYITPVTSREGIFPDIVTHGDSVLGGAYILPNEPAATLVRSQGHIFLAVVQICSLILNSEPVQRISLDVLADKSVSIGYQILRLVPIQHDQDSAENPGPDWKWSLEYDPTLHKCPGRCIIPLDPDISTIHSQEPTYLFKSHALRSVCASLGQQLSTEDKKSIPTLPICLMFPYRSLQGSSVQFANTPNVS